MSETLDELLLELRRLAVHAGESETLKVDLDEAEDLIYRAFDAGWKARGATDA